MVLQAELMLYKSVKTGEHAVHIKINFFYRSKYPFIQIKFTALR